MSAPLELADLAPGALVTWLHVPRGGYGYTTPVDAEVISVGRKRVRIVVWTRKGERRERTVLPTSLRWRTPR